MKGIYSTTARRASGLPHLSPMLTKGLRRYKEELLKLAYTDHISGLVACCDAILTANEEGRS